MKINKQYSKECTVCGKLYFKNYNTGLPTWKKSMYCSKACFGIGQGIKSKKLQDRNCLNCGVVFNPASFGSKYCSPKCAKHRFENRRGENHQSWKGGRTVESSGYVRIRVWPNDPIIGKMVGKKDYVMEHRVVMARMLGRPLEEYETVHHKNGIRTDNRPENLELRTGKHGKGATHHCPTCTCAKEKIITQYLENFNFN